MEIVNQRLQRLVNTDICTAEDADEYRLELIHLANTLAESRTMKTWGQFFKALAEENRLRILRLLQVRDMCICELMIALEMTQPNLTHHLTILENQQLVTRTKRGKWVYCSLNTPEIISQIFQLRHQLISSLSVSTPVK